MRRRAGPWRFDGTADSAAGAVTLRPRSRVGWGIAVSLALHGVLLFALSSHRTAAPNAPRTAARMSVRLLMRAAPAVAPSELVALQSTASRSRSVTRKPPALPIRTETVKVSAPMAADVAAPIDGSVFGMPRIGFPGASASRSATPGPPNYAGPNPMAQMQAARDAGRAQIVSALEQQLNALQVPVDAIEAACSLPATPDAQVSCDNDSLREIVGPRTPALSGLLVAYRSVEPRASSLAIAYSQGRYRVSLGLSELH